MANDEIHDPWRKQELLVGRAIARSWCCLLTNPEFVFLSRLLTLTLAERRHSVDLPLGRLLDGRDQDGGRIALSMKLGLTSSRRAITTLKRLGLIGTERVGNATRFTVNSDEIIAGGGLGHSQPGGASQ